MRDERARKAHELLKRAIEIEAGGRTAFVEKQCNGDMLLRERVLALLRALDHSKDFLEAPPINELTNGKRAMPAAVPAEIAGYRIVRIIGEGGMARVYEAVQQRPHRRVALKVMNHGITQPSAVQRFLFETEVLARLRHPGIAQIYDAGSFDDGTGIAIPYFALEYIPDARPITAYADEHHLSIRERLQLAAQLCDAVQHGHQNGVIHRDLKPGNVLVDQAGQIKVIDFGIARSTDPELAWITKHTDVSHLVGTLNYMSPEQCAGAIDLDVRADVYSLGVILYELLCGRLPHDLTRVPIPEALRAVQRDTPPRPGSIKPALRGDLDAIILKAIEKDPERRYRTAAALAADLQRHLHHETIEARPPTLFYQTRMFARRHRALVFGAAAVMLSLLVGIVVATRFAIAASNELVLREKAEKDAIEQRDAAVWNSYVANIAAASAAIRVNELQFARRKLSEAPEKLRNWEWRFLNAATERSSTTIQAHDDMIFGFDLSRDGEHMATGSRDGTVRVWSGTACTLEAELIGHEHWVQSVSFSPDGSRIASSSVDDTVRIWNVHTGEELHTLTGHRGNVSFVAFGKGDLVASAGEDRQCILWNAVTGERIDTLADQPGGVTGVRFSHDDEWMITWNNGSVWVRSAGSSEVLHKLESNAQIYSVDVSLDKRWIAAGGDDGTIQLWDLELGGPPRELKANQSAFSVRAVALSPDGLTLASGHSDRDIRIWSTLTGEEQLRKYRGHEETVSGLAFTHDSAQLISASWDRTVRIWEFASEHRVDLVTSLQGHTAGLINTCFSPDGSMVASSASDHTVRLWDPELGTPLGTLTGHRGSIFGLTFSSDGRLIATGSHDRTVRLWNARTGAEEAVLSEHKGHVWAVTFSPDDRYLATGGNDLVIRLWDVATRQVVRTFEGHTSRVTSLAFSPDGKQLASASRDLSVRLWDVSTGVEIHKLEGHTSDVWAVLFNADGSRLYSGARDQTVRVWEPKSGVHLATLDGHGQIVTSLSLNPKGDRLAAGSWYGEIVMWDVPTLDIVLSFKGHEIVVRDVAFDPTGRWLASASYDKTVRIFDELGLHERWERRGEAQRNDQAAGEIVDRLFEQLQETALVAEAIENDAICSVQLRPWARKLVLRRALATETVEPVTSQ